MKLLTTPLAGCYILEAEPASDTRGFFARLFCQREFERDGLASGFVQINNSLSSQVGTLRGLHYQLSPKSETKVVRCIQGAVWDCVLDLRPSSATFGNWFGSEISAQNRKMMYVPKGFAHGFISVTNNAELLYFVDEFYDPQLERGIRWNDPSFAIQWPLVPSIISERDLAHPDFRLSEA